MSSGLVQFLICFGQKYILAERKSWKLRLKKQLLFYFLAIYLLQFNRNKYLLRILLAAAKKRRLHS